MLEKKIDINFRGIASIYVELSKIKKNKILPHDFNWLYFGDKKINFNRITEPTSMSNKLDLNHDERKYLILETCLDHESNEKKIKEKLNSAIEDLNDLPFIESEILASSYNWEKYVYPIQTLKNRINLKDVQNWISKRAINLESIGTSADFAYNDIQLVFKKAKELAFDINNSNKFNLSKVFFNKAVNEKKFSHALDKVNNHEKNILSLINSIYLNPKPCQIIAEIGINHNGSIDQLLKLCDLACNSGANIVKFQYFDAKKRIGKNVRELEHTEKALDLEENILQLLNRCELNLNDLSKAKEYVTSKGKDVMCTPFSKNSFLELVEIGFKKIKISSMDLNNYHLHNQIVSYKKKLNLFISTGMSNIDELKQIYNIYKDSVHDVCFLLCTSSYPAPNYDISLSNLLLYKSLFPKFKIGYSDHTVGNIASIVAASLGAEFLEIHFSDDIRKSGPDQILSKTDKDLEIITKEIKVISELTKFIPKDLRQSEYSTWRTQKKD